MNTYSHIPIHIRITNREWIDPDYTPRSYWRHERLLNHARATSDRIARREISPQVLWWVSQDPHSRLVGAAGALGVSPETLRNAIKSYRREVTT